MVKCNVDGSVERYKAILITSVFNQTHGIDYQENFALVVKINSNKVLLSLKINFN